MSNFINEFKQFAMRGNVIDMAVGVIIGGAFGKIVSSLVDDVIMPPIGWLIGGVDFSSLKITLPAKELAEGVETQAATINYGMFLQNTLDFLIVAFCIFLLIKGINKLTKKKEEAPKETPAPEPSNEDKLLTEIRDLLKNNNK
jgi:large conductance mechanosensitive channel